MRNSKRIQSTKPCWIIHRNCIIQRELCAQSKYFWYRHHILNTPVKSSGYYMYSTSGIQKFSSTHWVHFIWISEIIINISIHNIIRLVFCNWDEVCLLWGMSWILQNKIQVKFNLTMVKCCKIHVRYFACRSVNKEHMLLSMPISQHRTYIAFHADQSTKTQTNLNSIKSVRRSITSEGHDTGVAQEKRCTQPAVSSTNIGTPTTLEHQNSIRMLFLTPLRHSEPPAIGLIYVRWQWRK